MRRFTSVDFLRLVSGKAVPLPRPNAARILLNIGGSSRRRSFIFFLIQTIPSNVRTELQDDGDLCALPLILDDYLPPFYRLPTFLVKLGMALESRREQECLHAIAVELSEFYAYKHLANESPQPSDEDQLDDGDGGDTETYKVFK